MQRLLETRIEEQAAMPFFSVFFAVSGAVEVVLKMHFRDDLEQCSDGSDEYVPVVVAGEVQTRACTSLHIRLNAVTTGVVSYEPLLTAVKPFVSA
jgi:hypothetical protein